MKKKWIYATFREKLWLQRMLLMLPRMTFFVLLGTFSLSARAYSQNEVLTLKVKNEALADVLKKISVRTGYDFLYNYDMIKTKGKVSVEVTEMELNELLRKILIPKGLTFDFKDKLIVIRQADIAAQKPESFPVKLTGVVKDARGFPIPGVTVLIKGTSVGNATDKKGNFFIQFMAGEEKEVTLVFTFVGMETQEITVKHLRDPEEIKVVMKEDQVTLEDVVVTGYANIKKSSFTGASTRVEKKDILKISPRNVIDVLQVFDPSLRMAKNNEMGSDPNTLPEFYIRGRTGMEGVKELDMMEATQSGNLSKFALTNNPNTPIFILDGYEVKVEKIYDLDPNRIESITILKDAAATALYGSRAANGVIVVESVTPELGKLNVSYSANVSLTAPDLSDYNLMNAEEKLHTEILAGIYDLTDPYSIQSLVKKQNAVARGVNTDWLSQPLQNQWNHSHSLSFDGGTEGFRFGANLNYNKESGVMKDSYRNNFSAGMYIDYRVGKIQIRNHVSFDYMKSEDSPYGSFSDYSRQLPYEEIRDASGKFLKVLTFSGKENPLYEATLGNFSTSDYNTITNNLSFDWYMMSRLQFKAQFAISQHVATSEDFTDPLSATYSESSSSPFERGDLIHDEMKTFNWNLNAFLSYYNSFNKHNLNMSLGINASADKSANLSSHYRGFPSASQHSIGHANEIVEKPDGMDNKTRLAGIFLSANYTYDDIYLADASVRFDGSSEFGSEKRFATFWSAGAGINIHNYEFMKHSFVDQLKIRGTYGQTGKVNYPPYAARDMYNILLDDWYTTGMGAVLNYLGNEKLQWEKTNTLNIGADVSLFQGRFSLSGSWYNRRTKDMITDVTIPSSSGFTSYKDNMGEVENKGYEFTLNAVVLNTKDFGVNVFFNLAHNEGRLLKLAESLKEYNERVDEYYASRHLFGYLINDKKYAKPFLKYEEGGSLTSIYGMKSMGINPMDGKEVYLNRAGELTSQWESSEQVIIGNSEPKAQGSFGFSMRYKRFSLYLTCMYEFGGQEYNQTLVDNVENADIAGSNVDKRVLTARWQKPGDVTPLKNIADRESTTQPSSRFIQDLNELRINSISLGYDFNPERLEKIRLKTLRLQLSTNDLAVFSTVKQERGLSYPFARTFNFSLSTSF